MATSGTVGATTISVQTLIDHGARRAGKLAEELTAEQVLSAKDSLFYLLSNLANRGVQYWCIDKVVIGLYYEQHGYSLPVGTVDILNANYRTVTRITTNPFSSSGIAANAFDADPTTSCTLTTNTGNIGIDNSSSGSIYISVVGILPSVSGSVTVAIQASQDNVTWTTVYAPGATAWVAGTWLYYDLDPSTVAPYWRIVQSAGVNMGVTELVFGTAPIEIPMARLNRDDYVNLPNKSFLSATPLQYWFNRSLPQPQVQVWPTPNSMLPQLVLITHRHIQDVGDLGGQIEIPQRWYLAIQNMLAHQMAMELPQIADARIAYLEQQADKYWHMAEEEERDKSPIYLAPAISCYTK